MCSAALRVLLLLTTNGRLLSVIQTSIQKLLGLPGIMVTNLFVVSDANMKLAYCTILQCLHDQGVKPSDCEFAKLSRMLSWYYWNIPINRWGLFEGQYILISL